MKKLSKRSVVLERAAQLLALTGLGISSPLLHILQDGPEFFVNRRALPLDIVLSVAIIVFAPPLILLALEGVGRLLGRTVSHALHVVFVVLLTAIVVVPLIESHFPIVWTVSVAAGLLAGVVIGFSIARFAAARMWLSLLSVLALITTAGFFASDGIKTLIFPQQANEESRFTKGSDTPVVVLIFDEFPLNGLLNQQLEIDAERFPNFAALAKDSTWFREATAVNQFTPIALPAILSGRMPRSLKQLPTVQSYPINLFTLLARSHAVTAYEPFTKLCPDAVCPKGKTRESRKKRLAFIFSDLAAVYLNYAVPEDANVGVPDIDGKWGDFWNEEAGDWDAPNFSRTGRVESFQRFLKNIKPSEKPPFIFAHTILPHMPHQFVPSGKMYPPGFIRAYVRDRWTENQSLQEIGYQQFLLQLGATDRVLGLFINRLKEIGVYDKALVVVVADHGASFQPHTHRRGDIKHQAFFEDVMSIPFFIKLPGKDQGVISDRRAETIDVVPTVLDVLGLDYKIQFDGVSLFKEDAPNRTEKDLLVGRIPNKDAAIEGNRKKNELEGQVISFKAPEKFPRATVDWKYSLPGYTAVNPHNPYYIGLRSELLGAKVSDAAVSSSAATFELFQRSRKPDGKKVNDVVRYDPRSGICPCSLQGTVAGGDVAAGDEVAIAINGVFEGFTRLSQGDKGDLRFSFFVLDKMFVSGLNTIELFKVDGLRDNTLSVKKIAPLQ